MATDLTGLIGSVFVDASFKATKTEDLSIPQDALAWRETLSFTFGDAVVKVDQLWHDQRSINPAANDDIDLQTELNGFGLAIALDTARVVIIRPVGGALKVGAPVTFQWQAWFAAAGDIELVGEDGYEGLSLLIFGTVGYEGDSVSHSFIVPTGIVPAMPPPPAAE